MKKYCLGFAFNLPRTYCFIDPNPNVALIRKKRPEWQAGKLNGIGGHVEDGESFVQAMSREFREEAGVIVLERDWELFARIESPKFEMEVFRAFNVPLHETFSATDEEVYVTRSGQLPHNVLPNLRWQIPLALDLEDKMASVVYTGN